MLGITNQTIQGWSPQGLPLTVWLNDFPGNITFTAPWYGLPSEGSSGDQNQNHTFGNLAGSVDFGPPLNGHLTAQFTGATNDQLTGGTCDLYMNTDQFYCWILLTASSSALQILGADASSGSNGFRLNVVSSQFNVDYFGVSLPIMASGTVTVGKWYLVIFNLGGGKASGLVAGHKDAAATSGSASGVANFTSLSSKGFRIGCASTVSSTNSFGGNVAEVGLSNINLDQNGTCYGKVAQNIRNYINARYQLQFPQLQYDAGT